MYIKQGPKTLVMYLKAAHVIMQQSIGGHYLEDMTPLGLRIRRTKGSKLPRIIPVLHRARIRAGDRNVIRFWLTMFSIYRIIEYPNYRGFIDFTSITDKGPIIDPLLVESFRSFVYDGFLRSLTITSRGTRMLEDMDLKKGLPHLKHRFEGDQPFMATLKAEPFLIGKSTPVVKGKGKISPLSTSPIGIIIAAATWLKSPYYPILRKWCTATKNQWLLNRIDM